MILCTRAINYTLYQDFTMKKITIITITLTTLLNFHTTPSVAEVFSGRVWVIDGDSLRVTLKNGTKKEVRLFGINAPELQTHAGRKAKYYMINLIKQGRYVKCTKVDTDRYKRHVSICKNRTGDLAENMLRAGHAIVYTKYIVNATAELKKRYYAAYRNRKP